MKKLIANVKRLLNSIRHNEYVRKAARFVRNFALFLWFYIKKFSKIAFKFLRKLPWKIILIISAIIILLLAGLFNFYIADKDRITVQYQSNLVAYTTLLDTFENADLYMSDVSMLKRDMRTSLDSVDNLKETANQTNVSLPRRFVSEYALSGIEELDKQLNVIYGSDSDVNIAQISSYSGAHAELIRSTNELFTKSIENDTNGYIAYLEKTIKELEDLEKNNEELDLKTLTRIYQQILNSAEQYKIDQDIEKFNAQFFNVSSELYKEIIKSWEESMTPLRAWASAQKSSFESILNSL